VQGVDVALVTGGNRGLGRETAKQLAARGYQVLLGSRNLDDGAALMLAEPLRGSGVLVNAVCPGWVATDMGGSGGQPVADGATGIVWAATLPDDGPTGGFFRDGRPLEW
jgi:NAD(P)-dependent dehydrogenase (short-subunit alcohol dehydrogenase family)